MRRLEIIDSTYQIDAHIRTRTVTNSIKINSRWVERNDGNCLAKRNNVTFDGNQQNIASTVSKLCFILLHIRRRRLFFSLNIFICTYEWQIVFNKSKRMHKRLERHLVI